MQQLPRTQNEYSELNDSCSRLININNSDTQNNRVIRIAKNTVSNERRLNRGQPQTLKQQTSSLKVRQVVQMSLEWPK